MSMYVAIDLIMKTIKPHFIIEIAVVAPFCEEQNIISCATAQKSYGYDEVIPQTSRDFDICISATTAIAAIKPCQGQNA